MAAWERDNGQALPGAADSVLKRARVGAAHSGGDGSMVLAWEWMLN